MIINGTMRITSSDSANKLFLSPSFDTGDIPLIVDAEVPFHRWKMDDPHERISTRVRHSPYLSCDACKAERRTLGFQLAGFSAGFGLCPDCYFAYCDGGLIIDEYGDWQLVNEASQ